MIYEDIELDNLTDNEVFGVGKTATITENNLFVSYNNNNDKNPMKLEEKEWDQKKAGNSVKNAAKIAFSFSLDELDKCAPAVKKEQKVVMYSSGKCSDFRQRVANTYQEKLSVLEDRDKRLREGAVASKNMNSMARGTCPDMCPEKERLLREVNCYFSPYEGAVTADHEMHVVPEFLVKEYSRSSADQDEPLPHELRPRPVLVATMQHMVHNIMPRVEDADVDLSEWYHFCWDRLRAIRKDIIQQQLCDASIVAILEQSARFHIVCGHLLRDQAPDIFDEKINTENLVNCLQMLLAMYEELGHDEKRGCHNQAEFRTYSTLLRLNKGDAACAPCLRSDPDFQEAVRIYSAYTCNLYARFFKLVQGTTYLNACILQTYFAPIRTSVLNLSTSAFAPANKNAIIPVHHFKRTLYFDSEEETIAFVEAHGLTVTPHKFVVACKADFSVPDVKLNGTSELVKRKRRGIVETVLGPKTSFREEGEKKELFKVYDSFGVDNVLKKGADDASDQREEIFRRYGGDAYKGRMEPKVESQVQPEVVPEPVFFTLKRKASKVEENTIVSMKSVKKVEEADESLDLVAIPMASPKPLKHSPPKEVYRAEQIEPVMVNLRNSEAKMDSCVEEMEKFQHLLLEFETEQTRGGFGQLETAYANVIKDRLILKVKKRKLRRLYALKYGRLWRKKVKKIAEKIRWTPDVPPITLEQHLKLWGEPLKMELVSGGLARRLLKQRETAMMYDTLLNGPAQSPPFRGGELAEKVAKASAHTFHSVRRRRGVFVCFKVLISLPEGMDIGCQSLRTKVEELCRLSFYKGKELSVMEFQTTLGVKVYTRIVVGGKKGEDGLHGGVFVISGWETLLNTKNRLLAGVTQSQPFAPVIICLDSSLEADVNAFMKGLKKRGLILGWTRLEWRDFYTIVEGVMATASSFVQRLLYEKVEKIWTVVETTLMEHFGIMRYLQEEAIVNKCDVATYVQCYNKALKRTGDSLKTGAGLNLSEEFEAAVCGGEARLSNLTRLDLVRETLDSFGLYELKNWPPKTTGKLTKLLKKYCGLLDAEGTLWPQVARIVNVAPGEDVEGVNTRVDWLDVVELWAQYALDNRRRSGDVNHVWIFHDDVETTAQAGNALFWIDYLTEMQ